MNINKNNFETYFLLYADDELCVDDKRLVEKFVRDNDDVKQAFDDILATKLMATNIKYENKHLLFKYDVVDNVLQEKLLLKIDDELNVEENISLQKELSSNKIAAAYFEELSVAQLDKTEHIVFAHKHLLYKKETSKLIIGRFAKWAAAAAIIGFGLFIGLKKVIITKDDSLAAKPIIKSKKTIDSVQKIDSTLVKNSIIRNMNDSSIAASNTKINEPSNVKEHMAANKIVENLTKNKIDYNKTNIAKTKDKQQDKIEQPNINLPQPIVIALKNTNTIVKQTDNSVTPLETNNTETLTYIEVDKNKAGYTSLNDDEVKRTKIGGFLKKMKRIVERNANIKPSGSLAIAGFEVASN